MVIDLPPGTGDEPISIAQLIPDATGAIIVTTPQDIALSSVRRSMRFAEMLKLPIVGVIENMSGFFCPHCGSESKLFKSGGGKRVAGEFGVPFLGRVPIDEKVVEAEDAGVAYLTERGSDAAKAFGEVVARVEEVLHSSKKAGEEKGNNSTLRERVIMAVERARPGMQSDGGDIELVDIDEEQSLIKVRFKGACSGCAFSNSSTLKNVEAVVKRYAPEIKAVINAQEVKEW